VALFSFVRLGFLGDGKVREWHQSLTMGSNPALGLATSQPPNQHYADHDDKENG
jgi:hypothetical protein